MPNNLRTKTAISPVWPFCRLMWVLPAALLVEVPRRRCRRDWERLSDDSPPPHPGHHRWDGRRRGLRPDVGGIPPELGMAARPGLVSAGHGAPRRRAAPPVGAFLRERVLRPGPSAARARGRRGGVRGAEAQAARGAGAGVLCAAERIRDLGGQES